MVYFVPLMTIYDISVPNEDRFGRSALIYVLLKPFQLFFYHGYVESPEILINIQFVYSISVFGFWLHEDSKASGS